MEPAGVFRKFGNMQTWEYGNMFDVLGVIGVFGVLGGKVER